MMMINPRYTFISSTMIDDYLYRIESYLTQHHGSSIAYLDIDPLRWYIRTGRASTQFLGLLLQKKPYMIARKLHDGGSTDEAVQRIKDYIGFD